MKFSKMRLLLTATLAGCAIGATNTSAQTEYPVEQEKQQLRNSCKTLYTQKEFRKYAKSVYLRKKISSKSERRVILMMRCQSSSEAERKMKRLRRKWLSARKMWLATLAVTPFSGPNGTRWAIPWPVVNCEREKRYGMSGIWRSHNPSGALGPYQLLGHGAPWPANTPARRLKHHLIARSLYRSRGLQPWVSSSGCWS